MSINKEREELHKTIWAIANDLRGAIDEVNTVQGTTLRAELEAVINELGE